MSTWTRRTHHARSHGPFLPHAAFQEPNTIPHIHCPTRNISTQFRENGAPPEKGQVDSDTTTALKKFLSQQN